MPRPPARLTRAGSKRLGSSQAVSNVSKHLESSQNASKRLGSAQAVSSLVGGRSLGPVDLCALLRSVQVLLTIPGSSCILKRRCRASRPARGIPAVTDTSPGTNGMSSTLLTPGFDLYPAGTEEVHRQARAECPATEACRARCETAHHGAARLQRRLECRQRTEFSCSAPARCRSTGQAPAP